jgi:hypothetical protein
MKIQLTPSPSLYLKRGEIALYSSPSLLEEKGLGDEFRQPEQIFPL